ncbi:MAG: hypothetical protein KDB07_03165, partial [Planctomycetes bacterium]|nr:hypothetical protein [Planctomycetota bacterium]
MAALEKLSSYIMSASPCGESMSERCEHLGHKAAQLAIDANIPLTDAVVKVATAYPDLNNRHINNIVWVANNEYFRKVASARKEAGENLVFDFELADPPDITKQLNDSAAPKVAHIVRSDYGSSPSTVMKTGHEKNSTAVPVDAVRRRIRDHQELMEGKEAHVDRGYRYAHSDDDEKTAAMRRRHALDDLGALRDESVRVANMAVSKHAELEGLAMETKERFYAFFKQAALSRITAAEMTDLLAQHPAGEEVLLRELGKVAQRMAHEEPMLYSGFQK